MIVHEPEIRYAEGEVCVSARVEVKTAVPGMPDMLWFKLPAGSEAFVTDRADGFAASLLLLAMTLGEDMDVRGVLSPRLAFGMAEYQRIFHYWFPQQYRLIDIQCSKYERQHDDDVGGAVATAFSGGVDSFHTLWSHLPQNESNPHYRLTHALFVQGFDIELKEEATYRTASEAYSELMEELGLTLLTVRTNLRQLTATLDWGHTFGSALIGVALVLGRLLARFYVPGPHPYSASYPWGSTHLLDHLLAAETLEVVHDATATRTEKTATIAQWPETYARLRVCWTKKEGLRNCCRCEKCIRTMTSLDVLGALHNYTTFPLPLERQHIRGCRIQSESERDFWREIFDEATAVGRKDIAFDVRYARARNRLALPAREVRKRVAPWVRRGTRV